VNAQISLAGIKAAETLLTGPYISVLAGHSSVQSQHFFVQQQASHYGNVDNKALKFTLEDVQLGSIKAGTQVFYRGIAIGQVDGYSLNQAGNKVQLFAHIEAPYSHLVNQTSQFWDASGIKVDVGLFSGAKIETTSLETILAGGINVITQAVTTQDNSLQQGSILPLQPRVNEEWLNWEPTQNPAQYVD
jgi:paraquat-inducible protein B